MRLASGRTRSPPSAAGSSAPAAPRRGRRPRADTRKGLGVRPNPGRGREHAARGGEQVVREEPPMRGPSASTCSTASVSPRPATPWEDMAGKRPSSASAGNAAPRVQPLRDDARRCGGARLKGPRADCAPASGAGRWNHTDSGLFDRHRGPRRWWRHAASRPQSALVLGAGLMLGATRGPGWRLRQVQPFASVCEWLRPPAHPSGPNGRFHAAGGWRVQCL